MPVSYRIDGDVVTLQSSGVHSTAELREAWLAAEADPAFPSPATRVRICVDARASESLGKRSVNDLRGTADWFELHASGTSRMCAFITRPGLQYGFARMMSAWIEFRGYRTFVTTDVKQAAIWLTQPD